MLKIFSSKNIQTQLDGMLLIALTPSEREMVYHRHASNTPVTVG